VVLALLALRKFVSMMLLTVGNYKMSEVEMVSEMGCSYKIS